MADPGFELTFVWTQSLYCFNYVVYVIYVYDRTLKTIGASAMWAKIISLVIDISDQKTSDNAIHSEVSKML